MCLTRHPRQTDSPLFPGRRRYSYNPATGPLDWSVSWDRDPFLKNQFRPVLNEAGLPSSVRPHNLRHAFASICAARVIPLSRVPRYLGHSRIAITDALYMPLFATDADADMARLPRPEVVATSGTVVPLRAEDRLTTTLSSPPRVTVNTTTPEAVVGIESFTGCRRSAHDRRRRCGPKSTSRAIHQDSCVP